MRSQLLESKHNVNNDFFIYLQVFYALTVGRQIKSHQKTIKIESTINFKYNTKLKKNYFGVQSIKKCNKKAINHNKSLFVIQLLNI